MGKDLTRVGVIGAGVMGAQIAALFAGAGLSVELLDIVPKDGPSPDEERAGLKASNPTFRDRIAGAGIIKLLKSKPAALYSRGDALRIRPGNIEDHIGRLAECGWVIEAAVERMDVKRAIYDRLEGTLAPDTIISSNTSGLLWKTLTEGRGAAFKRRFLITHFFNPPRYMKLVEVVAGPETDAAVEDAAIRFLAGRLGKGVVRAKDTPAFVANRIGVFYVMDIMQRVEKEGWPIEAADEVLGKATGRPKSGVFRTLDMAGLDTLSFVAAELVKSCPDDPAIDRCRIPQFLQQMVVRGLTGDKAGRGFYFKDRATGVITAIDPSSLSYRPRVTFNTPSLAKAKTIADVAERMRAVVFADDQAGEIAWPVFKAILCYAADRVPEIADDVATVDSAMRWGYHWEMGPFETWDALGIRAVAERIEREGGKIPALVEGLLKSGRTGFYQSKDSKPLCFDAARRDYVEIPGFGKRLTFAALSKNAIVEKNAGASIIDMGDGIFACEFRTKMNTIDGDVMSMVGRAIDRVEKEGVGLLIANDGEHFSVGANLLLVAMAAGQKRWDEIDRMVREFQSMTQRIRFAAKPVMAVPFGMALGGGCEICVACAKRTASIETYIGFVEAGAGLVPAGGGCKNLLLMMEDIERRRRALLFRGEGMVDDGGPQPKANAAFELIAEAKVSGSAKEAVEMGLLLRDDLIVMDRELLLFEARRAIADLAKSYAPPSRRGDIVMAGHGGEMALANAVRGFVAKGPATEYDAFIAAKIARVLTGGDAPSVHVRSEEDILDLEREAFLSLCGEEKTQARMAHLLQTGKPLRN